jgi:hypothetical protein
MAVAVSLSLLQRSTANPATWPFADHALAWLQNAAMHLFIWICTLLLLALWSAAAWGLHRLLGLDPSWVGELKPLIDSIPFGAAIDAWVPGWRELLQALVDLTQSLLRGMGAAAPWLVGAVWGLGAALLLGAGALGSGIVVLVRRNSRPPSPPAPPSPPTGLSPTGLR